MAFRFMIFSLCLATLGLDTAATRVPVGGITPGAFTAQKMVSDYVYYVNLGAYASAAALFETGEARSSMALRLKEFESKFRKVGDAPLVTIARMSTLSEPNGEWVVRCVLIWRAEGYDGQAHRYVEREEMRVRQTGHNVTRIASARTTPLVLKHFSYPTRLDNAVRQALQGQ